MPSIHVFDATQFSVGQDPIALGDFAYRTVLSESNGTFASSEIVSGATPAGDRFWETTTSSSGYRILEWLGSPTSQDSEFLMLARRFRPEGSVWQYPGVGAILRFDLGEQDLVEGYFLGLRNNSDEIRLRVHRGDDPRLDTVGVADHELGDTDGAWVWIRGRVEGTFLSVRAWLDGEEEPSEWAFTVSDLNHQSGRIGIGDHHHGGDRLDLAWLSVGTEGLAAPFPGQYVFDPRALSNGYDPLGNEWLVRQGTWSSEIMAQAITPLGDGAWRLSGTGSDDNTALEFVGVPPTSERAEVLALVRRASDVEVLLATRMSASDPPSHSSLGLRNNTTQVRYRRVDDGEYAVSEPQVAHGVEPSVGSWLWVRTLADGSEFRTKAWLFGTEEPDWQLITEDGTHTEGAVGLSAHGESTERDIAWYSVGVGGLSPVEPVIEAGLGGRAAFGSASFTRPDPEEDLGEFVVQLPGAPEEGNLIVITVAGRRTPEGPPVVDQPGFEMAFYQNVEPDDSSWRRSLAMFWKVAGDSEPTAYTGSWPGMRDSAGVIVEEFFLSGEAEYLGNAASDSGTTEVDELTVGPTGPLPHGNKLVVKSLISRNLSFVGGQTDQAFVGDVGGLLGQGSGVSFWNSYANLEDHEGAFEVTANWDSEYDAAVIGGFLVFAAEGVELEPPEIEHFAISSTNANTGVISGYEHPGGLLLAFYSFPVPADFTTAKECAVSFAGEPMQLVARGYNARSGQTGAQIAVYALDVGGRTGDLVATEEGSTPNQRGLIAVSCGEDVGVFASSEAGAGGHSTEISTTVDSSIGDLVLFGFRHRMSAYDVESRFGDQELVVEDDEPTRMEVSATVATSSATEVGLTMDGTSSAQSMAAVAVALRRGFSPAFTYPAPFNPGVESVTGTTTLLTWEWTQ